MRKTLLSAVAVALLLGTSPVGAAEAQESPSSALSPVLTVSVSGYDAIKRDLEILAQASGTPQLSAMLEGMVQQSAGDLLKSIDTARPWGVVVQTDGASFSTYAFLPVTDLEQFVGFLKGLPDAPEIPEPDQDGVYGIQVPGRAMYIQQKGDWAFVADSREALDTVPADPMQVLGGLSERYAIVARLTVKNIPSATRDQFLLPIQMGIAMGQQRMPGESDAQHALRTKMTAQSMEEFTTALEETEAVQIGLAVDPGSKAVRLDIEMTAIEGTDTAKDYALAGESKSDLTGFFRPEAALTVLWAGMITESDAEQIKAVIDTYGAKALDDLDEQDLPEAQRKLAKQVVEDLMYVARKTAEARRMDFGLAVVADSDTLNLVAGGFVADAARLEELAKQVAEVAMQEDANLAEAIKLDAESHQGVRFHTVSIPKDQLPDDDAPEMLVGDALKGVVGFGKENVYVALGPRAAETLKQCIDQSQAAPGQSVAPFRLSVSASAIGRIVEGVGAAEELDPSGAAVLAALRQLGENDHVTLAAEAVPNGVRVRFEVEPGILKLIGTVVMTRLGGGPAGPPGGNF